MVMEDYTFHREVQAAYHPVPQTASTYCLCLITHICGLKLTMSYFKFNHIPLGELISRKGMATFPHKLKVERRL